MFVSMCDASELVYCIIQSSSPPSLPPSLSTGFTYTAVQVSAFERVGHRPNGSPMEAVIQDFITRGFSVDELFNVLKKIGHLEGMRTLWNYGEGGRETV